MPGRMTRGNDVGAGCAWAFMILFALIAAAFVIRALF